MNVKLPYKYNKLHIEILYTGEVSQDVYGCFLRPLDHLEYYFMLMNNAEQLTTLSAIHLISLIDSMKTYILLKSAS